MSKLIEPYISHPEKFKQIVTDRTFLSKPSYQMDIEDPNTQLLVQGILAHMEDVLYIDRQLENTFHNGIGYGLAACQMVKVRDNLAFNDIKPLNEEGQAPRFGMIRVPSMNGSKALEIDMINAQILAMSRPRSFKGEGCLSFPGQYVTTLRNRHVRVGFIDAHTLLPREIDFYDLEAVIMQHEIDHQDGVLMFDHVRKQAVADKSVKPNDKCPCGSGKKYKKCCMN